MKSFFLSILFPRIIKNGRKFLSAPEVKHPVPTASSSSSTTLAPRSRSASTSSTAADEHPENPVEAEEPSIVSAPQQEQARKPVDAKHGSLFDLYFLRGSIFLDGFLTSWVSLAHEGWHMYMAAAILPFASGTGSACKGVTLDFVSAEERADALGAIALVEKLGQSNVSTIATDVMWADPVL